MSSHRFISAVRNGDLQTIRNLLDSVDLSRSYPLHEAVKSGDTELVRLLLHAGADPLRQDENGITALTLAVRCGRQRILQAVLKCADLRALSAPMTLHEAARHGFAAKVHQLIRSGVDVNSPGPDGSTALRIAARHGHRDIVHALVNAGANPYPGLGETTTANLFQDLLWLGSALNPLALSMEDASPYSAREADEAIDALASLQDAAQTSKFRASVALVEACAGIRARAWKKHPGVMIFVESSAEEILRKQVRRTGFQLIHHNADLLLIPASSKFVTIAACGTRAISYGMTTRDLVRRLIEFDRRWVFYLLGCGSDWLEGRLARKPDTESAHQLAKRLAALSPDLAGDPAERAHTAYQLEQTGRFRLWWD